MNLTTPDIENRDLPGVNNAVKNVIFAIRKVTAHTLLIRLSHKLGLINGLLCPFDFYDWSFRSVEIK